MGKKPKKKVSLKEKKRMKMRNVDMAAVKSKIKKEFLQDFGSIGQHSNDIQTGHNISYEYCYSKYLIEEFNPHFVVLMTTYLNTIALIPSLIKNEIHIHKDMLSLVKELMMNELEITLFTLNLDHIGWSSKDLKLKIHWLYIGLLTKAQTNRSIKVYFSHYAQLNSEFRFCFEKWKSNVKEIENVTMEIYDRYKLLNKPYNSFCEKNFVDYNCIVDKIINLSQPYGEENKGVMIIKEENAFDLLNLPSFQPLQMIETTNDKSSIEVKAKKKRKNGSTKASPKREEPQEVYQDSMASKNFLMDFNSSSQKPLNEITQNLLLSQNSLFLDNSFLSDKNFLSPTPTRNFNMKQLFPLNDNKIFSSQNSGFLNMINMSQMSNNF